MGIDRGKAAALLSWWRDAGVDVAVQERPPSWLELADTPTTTQAPASVATQPNASPAQAAPISAPQPEQGKPAEPELAPLPNTLDALTDWLAQRSERRGARHIVATGPLEASIMVLGDRPDRTDMADALPFGGDHGALAAAMLKAMGIDYHDARLALLEPGHLPGERLSDHDTLGKIARAQIRLAKPKRLVLFGDAPARALIGKPLAKARGHLHDVEGVPAVATFHPRWLLARPQDKRLAWSDLLLLMGSR